MSDVKRLIEEALSEDRARHDITTQMTVPEGTVARGKLIAKEAGVLCGIGIFSDVFHVLDRRCNVTSSLADGDHLAKGKAFAEVSGPAQALLAGERTALNFIQHLSGVASLTARYVHETRGTRAKILDTRKTIPGLRRLQKYAVRCGGGENHRMDLLEMMLVKDNHLRLIKDLPETIRNVHEKSPGTRVEVECETIHEVENALKARADIIMLDNMDIPMMKKAIALIRKIKNVEIEISGGVTLKTVRKFAKLGVDRISVGALTHSASALDISLELSIV